ncbi:MAG: 6-bladed beta-propeller [Elusimicrobiota bacterium]
MKNQFLILSLMFSYTLIVQPAATQQRPPQDIVYPAAPDKPRIRLVKVIRSKKDIKGSKASFLDKLSASITGSDSSLPLLQKPYGIWVGNNKIYLTDTDERRVIYYDLTTSKISLIGDGGPGALSSPVSVAADSQGNIYVSDSGDHSIRAYTFDGKVLWRTADLGVAGKVNRPTGLSLTPEGEIVFLDTGNHRVVVLAKDGKFSREMCRNLKDPFALPNPSNLWVEPDGDMIISDSLIGRVHIFDKTGKHLSGFGEVGDSAGYMARPRGVATDSEGNVYVADALFSRVQMFTKTGELLMYFGEPGAGPGQLALPAGVFIDQADKIYIVDSKNKRVQIFEYIKYPQEPLKQP